MLSWTLESSRDAVKHRTTTEFLDQEISAAREYML